jgi:hypothetical protein
VIPNRMLKELGEAAARVNHQTTEHSTGCCLVCRRFLRDLYQALTDPGNWEPEPVSHQLEKLRDEIERLQAVISANGAAAHSPVAPVSPAGEEEQGNFFPPPGRINEDE